MNTTGYCFPFEFDLEIGSVDCTESNVCDPLRNDPDDRSNPDCPREGDYCFDRIDGTDCIQPTVGICECTKRCASRLLEVQTRRLGKGLGTKRDWSVEEEDTPH